MPRSFISRIVIVIVLIALAIFGLSRIDPTKTLKHVEKPVPENALAK